MATDYFVRFVDVKNGTIAGANNAQWFPVPSVSLGFDPSTPLGSGTTFGPLTLTMPSGAETTRLESDLLSGTGLIQVEVAAYNPALGQPLTDDYSFGLARLTGLTTDNTGTTLTLTYGEAQHASYANGSVQQKSNWDTATNAADYAPTIATPTSEKMLAFSSGPAPTTYSVRFQGGEAAPLSWSI